MRLALFHNLPSGGAKRTLAEECRRLSARHEIDVYTLTSADHEFSDIRKEVAEHWTFDFRPLPLMQSPFGRLNQLMRATDLLRLDVLARTLAREIDSRGYDAVLVHPCRFEQAPSVLAHLQTLTVYYCHEPPRLLYEPMPSRPYDDEAVGRRRVLNRLDPLPAVYRQRLRSRDQRNTRSAGSVLVNSRFMADAVSRIYGVRAAVSYHGVDVHQFRPLGLPRRHMVLSVGSLTPLKGFDFLIRAMGRYPAELRPLLVIASNFQNPPELAYLDALARELGVQVSFRGCVTDSDLLHLYNQARVVAYAPVGEPFGLVPLEAMACGTPIVAVAEGGVPESIVNKETGLLTSRDPAAFAAALQQVLRDPLLGERLGRAARAHVLASWTWEGAVARLEEHLDGVIARRRGGPFPRPFVTRPGTRSF
jgi:glycosyltransferase involved in cell wall biosynthesis